MSAVGLEHYVWMIIEEIVLCVHNIYFTLATLLYGVSGIQICNPVQ